MDPNGELAFLVPLAIVAIKGALAGAAMDAGMGLASQLIENGGDIDCLDWGGVLSSGVNGGISGGLTGPLGKAVTAAKKLRQAARGGETAATRAGRQMHKDWNPGEGFEKEVHLPSGKRADAVNWETRTIKELKPDNARAVRRGEKQIGDYQKELEEMTGEPWTGTVETYKRNP